VPPPTPSPTHPPFLGFLNNNNKKRVRLFGNGLLRALPAGLAALGRGRLLRALLRALRLRALLGRRLALGGCLAAGRTPLGSHD
jgi:hypothetical protein